VPDFSRQDFTLRRRLGAFRIIRYDQYHWCRRGKRLGKLRYPQIGRNQASDPAEDPREASEKLANNIKGAISELGNGAVQWMNEIRDAGQLWSIAAPTLFIVDEALRLSCPWLPAKLCYPRRALEKRGTEDTAGGGDGGFPWIDDGDPTGRWKMKCHDKSAGCGGRWEKHKARVRNVESTFALTLDRDANMQRECCVPLALSAPTPNPQWVSLAIIFHQFSSIESLLTDFRRLSGIFAADERPRKYFRSINFARSANSRLCAWILSLWLKRRECITRCNDVRNKFD
jgi:hypothetical protein